MNSVTLRIRGSGNKKTRGGITFEPIILPDNYNSIDNERFQKFTTLDAEAQLVILKQILSTLTETCNHDSVKFLIDIYLNADVKHPAKCMITRYVTKNDFIQSQFSTILTQELESLITNQSRPSEGLKSCIDVVSKLGSCTENFPTGANAVRNLETPLAGYLRDCLASCISALSDTKPLSPTEKNEIFNLAHSTLRLLLYLIQRVNDKDKLIPMFQDIRASLKCLMFDGDAPMDTKSVCGILYVYMHTMENGPDSWMDILNTNQTNQDVLDMLENESAQLSLYSAIATVIPTAQQHSHTVDGVPAVVRLTDNILDIGERSFAESTIILGVTRTLVQICKGLDQSRDTGLRLLDSLFVFVWSHLEHYTDSVQHLTAQALGHIVQYCARLRRDGDESAMSKLLSTLTSLERARKSFYISVTHLSDELGADAVTEIWPRVVEELLCALSVQAVQASATTALETLLRHDARRSSSDVIHARWVRPVVEHVASRELHSAELHILENLLSLAARLDPGVMNYILPYIKTVCSGEVEDIYKDVKRVLMLLSVARKAGALGTLTEGSHAADKWRDVIGYEVLNMAAVDFKQEIRILSISLVVESPKTTEPFAPRELDFVLHFVKYNMNSQSPHFRQLLLSIVKKFIKRLENSYKVLVRENSTSAAVDKGEYYVRFVRDLRALCLHGLVKGANYSRRHVALQILAWLDQMQDGLGSQDRVWTEDEVETLLQHLEDSYEVNKALALQLLTSCPDRLLKERKYSTSLEFEDVLTQASSVKPTDCVSAVYKLRLLQRKLPHSIVQGEDSTIPNRVKFALLNRLLSEARRQLSVCQQSIVYGARSAPMYGVLHCIGHTLEPGGPFGIPPDELSAVLQSLVATCVRVCGCAGAVLASAAPEGLLPEVTPRSATADPAHGSIRLEDGGEVTAQMVLLCAWRSVKEVSLILSTVVNQLLTYDEIELATLRYGLVKSIGELFTSLLMETKHRGAFEQVYVGFTRLLTSLWRSPKPEFNELPKVWLRELMAAIESGDSNGRLCATRRSAGLPFMIQALVITELQVKVNSKSFDSCMTTLLRLARSSPCTETRCHCLNILRALYRNSQLDEIVGTYVGEGLMVALLGFESGTWVERNSATLLFSALMVRVFGVQRSRDSEKLCVRNRMTGRIFFLRYPRLYDFMLNKLKQVRDEDKEQLLHPSLYPILLLLARLYPSSLEGTVSNLKLATFVPLVVRCAGAATLHTRRLAANAVAPLVPPDRYIPHVEGMLEMLCDTSVNRNFCHGILLQVLKLLDSRPENLSIDEKSQQHLRHLFVKSLWILAQCSHAAPCHVIADDYIKIINVLIWKFDSLLEDTFMNEIQKYLNILIFNIPESKINPGRELCLSNAVYLYLIVCNKYNNIREMRRFVYQCLSHPMNEVVLAMLNYLLILHGKLDIENPLQQHLYDISKKKIKDLEIATKHNKILEENEVEFPSENTGGANNNIVLNALKEETKYIEILCNILESSKYLECTQKCLRLITLEPNTQINIVKAKEGCNNDIKDAKKDIENIKDELIHNVVGITKDETRLDSEIDVVKDKEELRAQTGIIKDKSKELNSDHIIYTDQTQNTTIPDDIIMDKLIDYIENEHENLTHIYLASFCNFLTSRIKKHQIKSEKLLDALRVIFTYSLSDNDCETRNVVVEFLEKNLEKLLSGVYLEQLSEEEQFEFKATSWATTVTMLEDEDESIRSRASRVITTLPSSSSSSSSRFHHHHVVPSKAADVLLEMVQNDETHAVQLLSVLALLDFRAEVCMTDEANDECRVFDQNERYNVNLEETVLSRACARAALASANATNSHIKTSITSAPYRRTFDRLCGDNIAAFTKLVNGEKVIDINPKVEIFYNTLLV